MKLTQIIFDEFSLFSINFPICYYVCVQVIFSYLIHTIKLCRNITNHVQSSVLQALNVKNSTVSNSSYLSFLQRTQKLSNPNRSENNPIVTIVKFSKNYNDLSNAITKNSNLSHSPLPFYLMISLIQKMTLCGKYSKFRLIKLTRRYQVNESIVMNGNF